MKKSVIIIIIILVLIFAITGIFYYETSFVKNEPAAKNQKENQKIEQISPESVKGISQQEAEELCHFVMGEKDEETGFPFSFRVSGAVEKDGKQYYAVRGSWLVNNRNMSYIGDFFVSADGKEIYTGLFKTDEIEISDKIWSK